MSFRSNSLTWPRSGRRFLGVFVLTILLPGSLLAGLGVRALVQERRIAEAEIEKRLNRTADLAAQAIEREIASWQAAATRAGTASLFDASLLPDALRAVANEPGALAIAAVEPDGPEVWPSPQMLYEVGRPLTTSAVLVHAPAALAAAESAELRDRNYVTAITLYEGLLSTAVLADRPLFVHRLGRTYRSAGRRDAALARFRELQGFRQFIGALPADLIATFEICALWSAPVDAAHLAPCARDFYRDLVNGRWRLEKARYLFYASTAREWLERTAASDQALVEIARVEASKTALTEAVAAFVESVDPRDQSARPAEFTNVAATSTHLVVTWTDRAAHRAIVMANDRLQTHAWPSILAVVADDDLNIEVVATGSVLFQSGAPPDVAAEPRVPMVSRALADARLPLRVRVWPRDPAALSAEISRRQMFYISLLGLVVLVMATGASFTVRAVRHELVVAQLKSDFVSTVSHEFRSPLTGIRQLGEMLLRGRVPSEARRQEYYARITSESERLSRLVEHLLDFSRMEAGRREYRMERIETAGWLHDVAAAFQAQRPSEVPEVRIAIPAALPPIHADPEALTCAVQNLLDNAVKYSPGRPAVWLEAEGEATGIAIRVRDEGEGINEEDRAQMFDTFFRGTDDLTRRVKGAGIGLSLVRHIVSAHGGRVACESHVGHGTTFSIHLPALT